MAKLSANSIVAAVPGQVWCDMQGESAVIEIESSTFYGFEGVGTLIWQMIQKPMRVSDITAAVVREYDVAETDCERDTLLFLESLLDARLIEVKAA